MKIKRNVSGERKILTLIMAMVLSIMAISSNLSGQTNYYFSSLEGDDSRTSAQAQNPLTPWKSITKLNSFFENISPGDSILFKRGESFYGSLVVTKSGTIGNPIVISAYGIGSKPVITGFSMITSWNALGNNIYESTVPNNRKTVNCVVINGLLQPIGRYPKLGAANGGYLDFEGHSENGQITDNQLSGVPNWTGGEIVIRKNHWVIDRTNITSHAENVINFTPVTNFYKLVDGSGYFIQNHPSTLTQNGDWCYDFPSNKLKIYYSTQPPDVKVATLDQLLTILSKSYINIFNISFEGADKRALYANDTQALSIDSCNFNFSGTYSVYLDQMKGNIKFNNNIISNSLNNGIEFISNKANGCYFTINNNIITNSGVIAGMGKGGDGMYKAMVITADKGANIEYNIIKNTGYIPLEFKGNNILIKNNVIDNYCIVKDDGGGIYTWNGGFPVKKFTNRIIKGNIVSNGVGNPDGTFDKAAQPMGQAYGIYMDNNVNHVDILDNTVFNITGIGNHNNSTSFISITGNTFYNVGSCFDIVRWLNDGYSPVNSGQDITNMNIQHNIFFTTSTDQSAFEYLDLGVNFPLLSSVKERISAMGIIDNNYYHLPSALGFGFRYRNDKSSPLISSPPLTLANWRSFTGYEQNGQIIPSISSYNLNNLVSANLYDNGQFSNNISGVKSFTSSNNHIVTFDDSSRITGSGSLKVSFKEASPSPSDYVLLQAPIGSVSSDKNYILRFSTLGTTEGGIVRVCFRNTDSANNELTPFQSKPFGISRIDHEFLIKAPTSVKNASWGIDIYQGSGTTYIDNVEVYEANATDVNMNDRVRLEVNSTNSIKTVNLGATYTGVDGTQYNDSIILQPFSSKTLIRN